MPSDGRDQSHRAGYGWRDPGSAWVFHHRGRGHVGPGRGPRVLATFGDIRSARLPDIPTAQEQNLSGLPSGPWRGLAGPPDLPEPMRAGLVIAITKAYEDPQWKAFVQRHGLTGSLRTGAELERYLEAETGALRLTMQSLGLLAR
jgi:tripartite-type tricarboxylate transporter receptor subunit TctC